MNELKTETHRIRMAESHDMRMLHFLRNCSTFPKWLCYFTLPPVVYEKSNCFTFSPTLDIVNFLNFSYSNWYVGISL